jgi:hypothetical protein
MESPLHIVGCVLASRPAAELIDGFVAQLRRERAVVLAKSAQSASFVRLGAPDVRLVTMALQAAAARGAAALRFGFAAAARQGPDPEGLDISTRSVVQANDLAAGAADGEVLVSPQLAVHLLEAGVALRSHQVHLAAGGLLTACRLEPAPRTGDGAAPQGTEPAVPAHAAPAAARADRGLAPLSAAARTETLGEVFAALLAKADDMARRQVDIEARQDAVLGKMTLVEQGQPSARHLADLEAELDAQLVRVSERLKFIDEVEQRIAQLQRVVVDLERRVADRLPRAAEMESLRTLADSLVAQMVEAHARLDGVAEAQQRLLPLTSQVAALEQALQASRRGVAELEGRLGEAGQVAERVEQKVESLGEREALVRAIHAEVEEIRRLGEEGRADVKFLAGQQQAVSGLRADVEALLARATDTDERMAAIEARRRAVEEVQARADAMAHMLGDIELKLELLGEQRAEIEHVGDKLARLDFSVQEAQNTLRALQREREVAERIERGLKALRSRVGAAPMT